jgi:hypothetical protein
MAEQFSELQMEALPGQHKQAEQQILYMVFPLQMQIPELLLVIMEEFSEPNECVQLIWKKDKRNTN